MELVEGDLGLGEVFGDALHEGGAHVDADVLDVRGVAVVGFEIVGELGDGVGTLAVGNEQHTALIDVDKERDVVMATLCSGFIDGDAYHLRIVGMRPRLLDPVVQHTPHLRIVLAHHPRRRRDRPPMPKGMSST